MSHKIHLQHTTHSGPTCQTGRAGASLRGEHITLPFAEFIERPEQLRCSRCEASKLFAFLERKSADAWIPEPDGAWMAYDDALVAAHRAKRLA